MPRMLRQALACAIALLMTSGLAVHVHALPRDIEFGLKAGANIGSCGDFDTFFDPAEWDPLPTMSKGSRVGVAVRGFVTYWVSDRLGIECGLSYYQAGCTRDFEIEVMGVQGELATTAAVNYVEIPVLFKYSFMRTAGSSPFIYAGPSLGIKTSAEFEMEATQEFMGQSLTISMTEDIDDYVKGTNLSLVFGGGYAMSLGQMTLMVEGSYALGLTNVVEETGRIEVDDGEYLDLDEAKTRTISIMAGIAFR